jgi:hypothetical protein
LDYSFYNSSEPGDVVYNTGALVMVTQIGFYKGFGCEVASEAELEFEANENMNDTLKGYLKNRATEEHRTYESRL